MTRNNNEEFTPNFQEKKEVSIISNFVKNLLTLKNLDSTIQQAQNAGLKKTLGAFDLIILGVGAIIGSGIFTVVGIAAAGSSTSVGAGPALVVSMILASLACIFSALCYSEFASMIPVAGSAYLYTYATLGEFMAWLIGWVLMLEYLVGYIAVVSAWSGYLIKFLEGFSSFLPSWITNPPIHLVHDYSTALSILTKEGIDPSTAIPTFLGIPLCINIPGILITILVVCVLIRGMQESKNMTAFLVAIKLGVVALFVLAGMFYVKPENWTPFAPNGFEGIFMGAFIIFFAYIGFDAIATAAEETKEPQKNLPIGIIGSLGVCTIIYVLIALVLTGIVPINLIDTTAPLSEAMKSVGQNWFAGLISVGTLASLTSVLLVLMLAGTRVLYAMSRDRFLPPIFQKLHPKYKTPHILTIVVGIICLIGSLTLDISTAAELCNFGTFASFIIVCVAVLILRKTDPNRPRPFKVPFSPFTPILGIVCCSFLTIYSLQFLSTSKIMFIIWVIMGIAFYFLYSYKQQRNAQKEETINEANNV